MGPVEGVLVIVIGRLGVSQLGALPHGADVAL